MFGNRGVGTSSGGLSAADVINDDSKEASEEETTIGTTEEGLVAMDNASEVVRLFVFRQR